jgi:hypothetical protein
LELKQLKGIHNKNISLSEPAGVALQELLSRFDLGPNNAKARTLSPEFGETQRSIHAFNLPRPIKNAGYIPTRESVEDAFADFKSPRRQAAISVSKQGRLVYYGTNGNESLAMPHFIDGVFERGGEQIAARDMKLVDWLEATGIRDILRETVKANMPRGRLLPEDVWAAPVPAPAVQPAPVPVINGARSLFSRFLQGSAEHAIGG